MYPWWWMDHPSKARLTNSGFSSSTYFLILALPLSYIYEGMQRIKGKPFSYSLPWPADLGNRNLSSRWKLDPEPRSKFEILPLKYDVLKISPHIYMNTPVDLGKRLQVKDHCCHNGRVNLIFSVLLTNLDFLRYRKSLTTNQLSPFFEKKFYSTSFCQASLSALDLSLKRGRQPRTVSSFSSSTLRDSLWSILT